jgi:hypothetical protein
MAEQVMGSRLKQLAGAAGGDIDVILSTPGMGAALFGDGDTKVVCSYGNWKADIPGQVPGNYGTLSLVGYTPPQPVEATMRSPLLDREEIPQIKAPPRGPSRTSYPGESFSLGHVEATGVTGQVEQNPHAHLGPSAPGPQEEPPAPPEQEPPNEGANWWRRAVR